MRCAAKILLKPDGVVTHLLRSSAVGRMRDLLDQSGLWEPLRRLVVRIRVRMERYETYEDKVRREVELFSGLDVADNTAHNWQGVSRAMVRVNRLLGAESGETDPGYFLDWVRRRFGPVPGWGLDLGCGLGDWPRRLIDARQGERYHAFDLNDAWIDQARKDPGNRGYPIEFFVADANRHAFPERFYSVVFLHDALHHVMDLEHVIDSIVRSLVPGGRLVLFDYVGPSRMQWVPFQLDSANALFQLLPETHRRISGERVKRKILLPDPTFLSPFEAIRSAEILPILSAQPSLHPLEVHRFCGLLPLILTDIAPNFPPGDEFGEGYIDLIWEWERVLQRAGLVTGNIVVAVFEKRWE